MRALYISCLLMAAWLVSCTAGQYEVLGCNPDVTTLGADDCAELNADPNDCTPYQCDKATERCVKKPRDFDRDGDPDSTCGGMDCNDRDASVNGVTTRICTCDAGGLVGKPCEAGVGACRRTSQYECRSNVAVCPASTLVGVPESYHPEKDPRNDTWDWNCDGKIEQKCCTMNADNCEDCPAPSCSATMMANFMNNNPNAICDEYCKSMTNCPFPDKKVLFRCSSDCGDKFAICYCKNVLLSTCATNSTGHPVLIDKVYCR